MTSDLQLKILIMNYADCTLCWRVDLSVDSNGVLISGVRLNVETEERRWSEEKKKGEKIEGWLVGKIPPWHFTSSTMYINVVTFANIIA